MSWQNTYFCNHAALIKKERIINITLKVRNIPFKLREGRTSEEPEWLPLHFTLFFILFFHLHTDWLGRKKVSR